MDHYLNDVVVKELMRLHDFFRLTSDILLDPFAMEVEVPPMHHLNSLIQFCISFLLILINCTSCILFIPDLLNVTGRTDPT